MIRNWRQAAIALLVAEVSGAMAKRFSPAF